MKTEFIMYAHIQKGIYCDIFENELLTRISDESIPIYKIMCRVVENGEYYGWVEDDELMFIYQLPCMVEMCFPYSIEEYEKDGIGYRVSVNIELIEN